MAEDERRHARPRTAQLTEDDMIDAAVDRAYEGVQVRLYRAKSVTDSYECNAGPVPHWGPTLELWRTLPWHNNWVNIMVAMLEYSQSTWRHALPFLHVHIVLPSPPYRKLWSAGEEPEYKAVALAEVAGYDIPEPDDIHVLTVGRSVHGYWLEFTKNTMELWPQEGSITDEQVHTKIKAAIDSNVRAIVERRLLATRVLVDELGVLPRDVAVSEIAPFMLTYKKKAGRRNSSDTCSPQQLGRCMDYYRPPRRRLSRLARRSSVVGRAP